MLAEAFWFRHRDAAELERRVSLRGWEQVDAARAARRPVIILTGHCGNWELLAAWGAAIGWPITVVVRRVTDLRFHALIVRFRTAAGVEVLVRDDPNFVRGRISIEKRAIVGDFEARVDSELRERVSEGSIARFDVVAVSFTVGRDVNERSFFGEAL